MGFKFDSVEIFQPNNHSDPLIRWEPVPSNDIELSLPWMVFKNFYPHDKDYEVSRLASSGNMKARVFRVTHYCEAEDTTLVSLFRKADWGKWIPEQYMDEIPDISSAAWNLPQSARFRTPQPIEGQNEYFTYWHENAAWHVYDFIEGNYFAGNHLQLPEAACEIARMHKALARGERFIIRQSTPDHSFFDMEFIEKRLNRIKNEKGEINDLVRNAAVTVLSNGNELVKRFNGMVTRIQQIHGDLHPHNFIFLGNRLMGIIDFTIGGFRYLVSDIAMACHRLVRQTIVRQLGNQSDSEKVRDCAAEYLAVFVNTYAKEYGPEMKLFCPQIYPFMTASLLHKMTGSIFRYSDGSYSPEKAESEIRKFLMLLAEVKYFESIVPDLSFFVET